MEKDALDHFTTASTLLTWLESIDLLHFSSKPALTILTKSLLSIQPAEILKHRKQQFTVKRFVNLIQKLKVGNALICVTTQRLGSKSKIGHMKLTHMIANPHAPNQILIVWPAPILTSTSLAS